MRYNHAERRRSRMPDRGKTIEDLKQLAKDDWILHFNDTDVKETAKAALALLKEQEPVKPEESGLVPDMYYCGICGAEMLNTGDGYRPDFCPYCGRAVKWCE